MTREEFQIMHSEIIEQFQWIEFNLKRIYSKMSNKPFTESLADLERDNWWKLVSMLCKMENENGTSIISEYNYKELEKARKIRNYWCHQCYLDICFIEDSDKKLIVKKGTPKRSLKIDFHYIETLSIDLQELYYKAPVTCSQL